MLIIILLAAVLMIGLEVPTLVKKKHWPELAVFSVYLSGGISLGVMIAFRLPFPDITRFIEFVFKPVTGWLYPA